MRLVKDQKETENPLLDDRRLRDKYVGRYEVLDQTKTLLLLPDDETATVKQIAEYYSSIRTEEEKALGMEDIIISEDAIQKRVPIWDFGFQELISEALRDSGLWYI